MAVINIDDAYILNETGAQVDKVTGLYFKDESTSTAEKAFAQLNIGTAGSNRNLLDNPWWGLNEVINQRGNTSGQTTHDAYSIDRWKMSYGSALGSWSIAADGITITAASGTYALFGQVLANKDAIEGKTVTASVLLGDGTIVSGTIPSFTWASNPIAYEHNGLQLRFLASGTFRVNVTGGNSKTIRAVKVEVGPVSTLANDVPPELSVARIPCYENHLRLKGQYAPVGYAIALSTTLALLAIPTPVPMRIAPTPSLSGTLYFNAGTPFAITTVQNPTLGVNQVMIQVVGTFDTGKVYLAQFRDANSYLDLSADL